MKAGKYLHNGEERAFLLRSDGALVDPAQLDSSTLPSAVRDSLRLLNSSGDAGFCTALPLLEEFTSGNRRWLQDAPTLPTNQITFRPPVRPRSFLCVGLNYRDHAAESKMALPKSPLLFAKTANAISAHKSAIPIPPHSSQLDFEAELAVVIGKQCRSVSREKASNFIAGYTCANDLSARDMQFADGQWYRGKSCDGFGPLGPWIVTATEIANPQSLRIQLRLNGQTMQDSNTCNLVFDVPALVEYVSAYITLEAGDVILTGTPPGVGFGRTPPVFLKSGDVTEVEIEKIGILLNQIS